MGILSDQPIDNSIELPINVDFVLGSEIVNRGIVRGTNKTAQLPIYSLWEREELWLRLTTPYNSSFRWLL